MFVLLIALMLWAASSGNSVTGVLAIGMAEYDASKLSCDGKEFSVNTENDSECPESFYGCYDKLRHQIFTNTSSTLSCGFQTRTGYDAAVAQISKLDCQTVIYTGMFGALSILRLPYNTLPPGTRHPKYGNVCHILVIDAASAPLVPAADAAEHGWHVVPVADPLPYESVGKSYKVSKLLGAALFPHVERYIFYDAPIMWRVSPLHIFDLMDGQPLGMFRHKRANRTTHIELLAATARMKTHARLENKEQLAIALNAQKEAYAGYDSTGMLVGHVIARDRTVDPGCVRLFECAWFGELHTFTYRDQPSVYYTLDNLGLLHHMKVLSNDCSTAILYRSGDKFTEPVFLDTPYKPLSSRQNRMCHR